MKKSATTRGEAPSLLIDARIKELDDWRGTTLSRIRALIKQLVAAEDTKAPLSDARIAQVLGEQGIVVARRTIAKYRESLQIPPVNQRKAL